MRTYEAVNSKVISFNRTPDAEAWRTACSVLKSGPILNRMFDQLKGNFSAMETASEVSFFHEVTDSADRVAMQVPKDRKIELFSFGMGPVEIPTEKLIAPLTDFIQITSSALSRFTRALPLMISPDRMEYWHIKGTGHTFDYSSEDMLFAILFSMPLSKAFEPMLSTPDSIQRVAIPQSEGLLCGIVRQNGTGPTGYGVNHYAVWKAARSKKSSEIMALDPDFSNTIHIQSFTNFRDMNPGQHRLYRRLNGLREDKQFNQDLSASFELMSKALLYQSKSFDPRRTIWQSVCDRVAAAVHSESGHNGYSHVKGKIPEARVASFG